MICFIFEMLLIKFEKSNSRYNEILINQICYLTWKSFKLKQKNLFLLIGVTKNSNFESILPRIDLSRFHSMWV